MDNCDPQRPVPILQIHGTSDSVVPYSGTSWSEAIDDVINYWVAHNELPATPTQEETIPTSPDTTANSTIEHIRYGAETTNTAVEHLKVINGDHEWLGQPNGRGQINADIDLNQYIWTFFSRYELDNHDNK